MRYATQSKPRKAIVRRIVRAMDLRKAGHLTRAEELRAREAMERRFRETE